MPQNLTASLTFFLTLAASSFALAAGKQPDIVFIIVDDLNDYLSCYEGHPNAKSPHIDSLAAKGMRFTQAYCNSPQCRPSRTSLNHGVYPFKTGIYFNAKSQTEAKIDTPTIQQFFKENGYRVASGGKVRHGGPGNIGDSLLKRPKDPKPPASEDKFHALNPPSDGYPLKVEDDEMGDYKVATWAIEEWQNPSDKPLFMSVGFYRPHRPLQVPESYFADFPIESIKRPAEPAEDDWNDMPRFAKMLARSHAHKDMHAGLSDHEHIMAHQQWEATLQAYLASIAFVDQQIGRFLDALQNNPRNRETYIMLVSDHGWHLGEKKHWCKGAIWEQTTRIPFIVSAPGISPGSQCAEPASLVDVYPSLVDFAGLQIPSYLDGQSVLPQLRDPSIKRSPAISSYGESNTAIRSKRWRYIRYEDGSEELYDHSKDPNEWSNLATNPEFDEVKQRLAAAIPDDQHPGLKVQDWFDRYQSDFGN
ncbi:MAG: sulfatase [Verrucomicrobiota bacterium]